MSTDSMLRYWATVTQEEKDARSSKQAVSLRRYYEELNPKIQEARNQERGRSVSRYIDSLSEEEKVEWVSRSFGSEESRERARENGFGGLEARKRAVEGRQRYLDGLTPEESRKRLNKSLHSEVGKKNQKAFFANESEEDLDRRLKSTCLSPEAILKNQGKGPTELELFTGMYLEKNFPGEWAYNGGFEQRVMIGRRIPDFVSLKGRRIVVEAFGLYRHDEEDIKSRVEYYRDRGYVCVSLDSFEGYIEEDVVRKVGEALLSTSDGEGGVN